jgi:hypothetical protein
MTSCSERGTLLVIAALWLSCSGDDPGSEAERFSIRVKLINAGCDEGRVPDFRGFDVRLLAPRSERSTCVTGRPQTFAAIDDTLAGRISFKDLPEGTLTLKLLGYRDEGCRDDKLGMCGIGEATLGPTLMEVDVSVTCDPSAAFAACTAR